MAWRDRARFVDQLDDLRLKNIGKRLIFLNTQKFSSEEYRSAARTANRDRWLTNEPSAPWTTKATVELQLHEIVSGEALDQERINALQNFYQEGLSKIDV